jgi:GxxExxY protein
MNDEPRKTNLPCKEITDKIIRAFYKTMDTLGTVRGTPVNEFRSRMTEQCRKAGLRVTLDKVVDTGGHNHPEDMVTIDMVVEGLVVVVIKNILTIGPEHYAKGAYWMEIGGYPAGLLLNYGEKEKKPRRIMPPRKYRKGPWPCPEQEEE